MKIGHAWSVLREDGVLSCEVQDPEPSDHDRSWDRVMAEAVAFLISARLSLRKFSSEPSGNPQADRLLEAVSEKVSEALSALDDFCMTQWMSESTTPIGCSNAPLPTWSVCLDDLA